MNKEKLSFLKDQREKYLKTLQTAPYPNRITGILNIIDKEIQNTLQKENQNTKLNKYV